VTSLARAPTDATKTTSVPSAALTLSAGVKKLELFQLNVDCYVRPCEASAHPAKWNAREKAAVMAKGGMFVNVQYLNEIRQTAAM